MIETERAEALLEEYARKGWSLGSVESLTGGLFASTLCSIPGASRVYQGSIISYANAVKENLAHVKAETIRRYGVVSKEVAEEMALGGLEALRVTVAVSFTGNAGPTAEPGEAPVGEVDMAIAKKAPNGKITVVSFTKNLTGARNAIREASVNAMLLALQDVK
jgi:nicotinamide-nucleotide amidase